MEVIYLKRRARRPDESLLVECRSIHRGAIIKSSPQGPILRIATADLEKAIRSLDKKGLTKVYVRK